MELTSHHFPSENMARHYAASSFAPAATTTTATLVSATTADGMFGKLSVSLSFSLFP